MRYTGRSSDSYAATTSPSFEPKRSYSVRLDTPAERLRSATPVAVMPDAWNRSAATPAMRVVSGSTPFRVPIGFRGLYSPEHHRETDRFSEGGSRDAACDGPLPRPPRP